MRTQADYIIYDLTGKKNGNDYNNHLTPGHARDAAGASGFGWRASASAQASSWGVCRLC